jgi:DNA-binding GntR family transcriptional regulator
MASSSQLSLRPIEANVSLKDRIYGNLKDAICSMNIYAPDAELRLDERRLSEQLGISRTPLREALARLEQEGLITIVPRRGVFIVRKTKQEILEMITVWAALESMAARLVTLHSSDEEIASLRSLFSDFQGGEVQARIDEYSERNIRFHQKILELSRCKLLCEMADGLFLHMRGIRARTIGEEDRAARSIIDHIHIIEAIEARDTDLAERLVREHALNLASHVTEHVDYLT